MDNTLATRPVDRTAPRGDGPAPVTGVYAQPYYIPWTGEVRLGAKDMIAGALIAIIMIGPLAAAAIGRLMS